MGQSNRYREYMRSVRWYARRRRILKVWRNRCALFPWLPADHGHHLTYCNLERERAWRDCLPLSEFAHDKLIHAKIRWGRTRKGQPRFIEPFFPKRKPHSLRRRAFNLLWRVWSLGSLVLVWVGWMFGR